MRLETGSAVQGEAVASFSQATRRTCRLRKFSGLSLGYLIILYPGRETQKDNEQTWFLLSYRLKQCLAIRTIFCLALEDPPLQPQDHNALTWLVELHGFCAAAILSLAVVLFTERVKWAIDKVRSGLRLSQATVLKKKAGSDRAGGWAELAELNFKHICYISCQWPCPREHIHWIGLRISVYKQVIP